MIPTQPADDSLHPSFLPITHTSLPASRCSSGCSEALVVLLTRLSNSCLRSPSGPARQIAVSTLWRWFRLGRLVFRGRVVACFRAQWPNLIWGVAQFGAFL